MTTIPQAKFLPQQFQKSIKQISILAASRKHVTRLTLGLTMIMHMRLLLCLNRLKICFPYQHFIIILCYCQIVSITTYLLRCNITNTINQFSQISLAYHFYCIPLMSINMDNKGIKVISDRLSHIIWLTRILYYQVVIDDLFFVSIKVKATFVVLKIIFIRT